jgi:hypothetical protein
VQTELFRPISLGPWKNRFSVASAIGDLCKYGI